MARTPLFQRIKRLMILSHGANRRNMSDGQVLDRIAQVEFSRERREFMRTAAIGAAGALSVSLFHRNQLFAQIANPVAPSKNGNVLIIGGGAAGLAAAYTLKKHGVNFKLIEANRQGLTGRIFTLTGFNQDNQFVEMGGELVDTQHKTVQALCKEVGLEIESFAEGDQGLESEIFCFEQKVYSEADFVEGIRPLLKKIAAINDEIKPSADMALKYQYADKLPAAAKTYDNMTLKTYLDAEVETPSWIREALRMAYVGEFGLEADVQSALNLITMIDTDPDVDGFTMYGASDEAHRIKGGNMGLTKALFNAITNQGQLATNSASDGKAVALYEHFLIKIEQSASGKMICHFRAPNRSVLKAEADQVICCIPFTLLRGVEGLDQLGLSPVKLKAIQTYGYGTNSKMMMSFASRFWRRQGGPVAAHSGMMFVEDPVQSFWETSRLQAGTRGVLTNFLGGNAGRNADNTTVGGNSVMANPTLAAALNQLSVNYPMVRSQFENRIVVSNWSKVPTALGSYSSVRAGQYLTIIGSAPEPELDGRLLFAGEHTSAEFSGYMEGAYESGIRAAEELLMSRNIPIRQLKKAG